MMEKVSKRVAMLPVDRLTVLNPRSREKQRFREIVEKVVSLGVV